MPWLTPGVLLLIVFAYLVLKAELTRERPSR